MERLEPGRASAGTRHPRRRQRGQVARPERSGGAARHQVQVVVRTRQGIAAAAALWTCVLDPRAGCRHRGQFARSAGQRLQQRATAGPCPPVFALRARRRARGRAALRIGSDRAAAGRRIDEPHRHPELQRHACGQPDSHDARRASRLRATAGERARCGAARRARCVRQGRRRSVRPARESEGCRSARSVGGDP